MECFCILDNRFNFTLSFKEDYYVFRDFSKYNLGLTQDNVDAKVKLQIKFLDRTTNNATVSNQVEIYPAQGTILDYTSLYKNDCGYDGLYEFQITTCDNTQILSKNHFVLKNLKCAYSNLVREEDWDNAFKLFELLELIQANAVVSNFDKAYETYELAKSFIKKLNCSCNGNNI